MSREQYLDALERFGEVARELRDIAEDITRSGQQLYNRPESCGVIGSDSYPVEVHGRISEWFDPKTWPSLATISELLARWHHWDVEANRLYGQLSEEERAHVAKPRGLG